MSQDITIKIKDRKGQTHEVKVPTDMGLNLMQVVKAYELEPVGTVGICGGMGICPSCHCYAQSEFSLPEKKEIETMMLPRLVSVKTNSRLSCQIPITKELEGLEIEMAQMI